MDKNRAIYRTCVDCGAEFVISANFQAYLEENDLKLPKRCKKCRDARKETRKEVTCIDCGESFFITANESKFYSERGLTEPKRCRVCRDKRKNGKAKE